MIYKTVLTVCLHADISKIDHIGDYNTTFSYQRKKIIYSLYPDMNARGAI